MWALLIPVTALNIFAINLNRAVEKRRIHSRARRVMCPRDRATRDAIMNISNRRRYFTQTLDRLDHSSNININRHINISISNNSSINNNNNITTGERLHFPNGKAGINKSQL